jgi:hypothetical protein
MQRSPAVEAAVRGLYERFSANDIDGFAAGLAPESQGMVIGTGPTEWYEGRDAWIAAYGEQIAAIPGIRLQAGDPHGWEAGTVGWAADRPTIILPDGTPVPVRLTVVLLKDGPEWKPTQAHFSLGVPDELLPSVLGRSED